MSRVYAVRNKVSGVIRLVDCESQAQARKHVADDVFEVTIPTNKEVFALAGKGVAMEQYGETPEPEFQEVEEEVDAEIKRS